MCFDTPVGVDALIDPKCYSMQCTLGTMKGIVPYRKLQTYRKTTDISAGDKPLPYGVWFCKTQTVNGIAPIKFVIRFRFS